MRTKKAGTATTSGEMGADQYLKWYDCLPNYYISKETAKNYGWKSFLGNLHDIFPGKMIGGDVFSNSEGKLPAIYFVFSKKECKHLLKKLSRESEILTTETERNEIARIIKEEYIDKNIS